MKCFCLGVIGNFSGHLSGAENIEEATLPTGVFVINSLDESIITTGDKINFPPKGNRIQAEPEFVVKFDVTYLDGKVEKLSPRAMTIGNDMTIRQLEGADKIAQRKVWGDASKSFAKNWWYVNDLTQFSEQIKLTSYINRDNELIDYTPVADPTELKVFYQELCNWLRETINNQQSKGFLDEILPQLVSAGYPDEIIVFCGAPNYTPWGESNYIQKQDEVIIALINTQRISVDDIREKIANKQSISLLDSITYQQKVA